jgi:uncharacterized protein with GYD domain
MMRSQRPLHAAARAMGNIRTRTMKAFPEAAYREIINSLD